MKLGNANVQRIVDLDPFALPLDFLLPDARIDELREYGSVLAPDYVDFDAGNILLGVQSFVLQIGALNVLIDTCVGEHKDRSRRPEWHMRSGSGYLEGLANAGLRPEDVDIVLCTHLHADHIGWNTRLDNGRWVPTFPKARYLTGGKDLAFFRAQEQANPGVSNHGSFSDSVLPVEEAGQMETVEDGFDLGRGLSIVGLPGHSPGQVGLDLLFGAGEHVIFCGDAIHSPVQVYKPQWATRFCADAGTAVTTRMALMEQSADDGAMLLPSHLRNAMAMRIRRCNRGFEPILI